MFDISCMCCGHDTIDVSRPVQGQECDRCGWAQDERLDPETGASEVNQDTIHDYRVNFLVTGAPLTGK